MAPPSWALLDTAALDIVGRVAARESTSGRDSPRLPSPGPAEGAPTRGPLRSDELLSLDPPQLAPADQTVTEDLWAHPTEDLAALVADVLAQLTTVRAAG